LNDETYTKDLSGEYQQGMVLLSPHEETPYPLDFDNIVYEDISEDGLVVECVDSFIDNMIKEGRD